MPALTLDILLNPKLNLEKANALLEVLQRSFGSAGQKIQLIDPQEVARIEKADAALRGIQKDLAADASEALKLSDVLAAIGDRAENAGKRAGSAFDFNQKIEAVRNFSSGIESLAKPFTELDTATQSLKTLGPEAAAMADDLRQAALDMSSSWDGLPIKAGQLQQGMFDAIASGVQGGKKELGEFIQKVGELSVGGAAPLASATQLMTGTLNAFGESALSTGKYADYMFNIVNVGVTSIPELASQLANVTPTAAAAGVKFYGLGGALAFMTQKGVPMAQSTTKVNQLLIEMQKPGAALAPILKAAGVSMDSLRNEELPDILGRIKVAIDATGKSATQLFSSSEAGAAFNVLTGDMQGFAQAVEDVRDTSGSARNAYEQMSDSVEVRTQRMLTIAEDFAIKGLDKIGSGFVSAAAGATQIAPMITTLVGLKEIFPTESMLKFGQGLLGTVAPALIKVGILKVVGVTETVADTAATTANTAAKGVQAIATDAATGAQYALNAAFLASPLGIALALLAAGAAAYAIFSSKTKDLKTATEDAAQSQEKMNAALEGQQAAAKQQRELHKLADELDSVKGKSDPESQHKYAEALDRVARKAPEVVDHIDDLNQKLDGHKQRLDVSSDALRKYADEQKALADQRVAEQMADMDDQAKALQESITANVEKMRELRAERQQLNTKQGQQAAEADSWGKALLLGPVGVGLKLVGVLDGAKDKLKKTRDEINKMAPELEAARAQQTKMIDQYGQMGLTIDDIAAKLNVAADVVRELAPPDFASSLANAEQFKQSIAGMSDEQQKLVNAAVNHAEAYKKAQANVADLKRQLADAKFGNDKSLQDDLEKKLADAQKVADERRVKVEADLDDTGTQAAIKALPDTAQKLMKPVTMTLNVISDDRRVAQITQRTTGIIREANELAEQSTSKLTAAQRLVYDQKQATLAAEYRKNMEQQAAAIGANVDELHALEAQKLAASDPKEVARLSGEILAMNDKINQGGLAFQSAANQGKKVGLIKGDIANISKEFGFTGKAIQGVTVGLQQQQQQIRSNVVDAKSLADQFKEMNSLMDQAVQQDLAAIALVNVKRKLGRDLSEQEQKAAKEAAARLPQEVKDLKTAQAELKRLRIQYGLDKKEDKKKEDKTDQDALKLLELRQKNALALIDDQLLKEAVAAQQAIDLQKAKNVAEEKEDKARVKKKEITQKDFETRQSARQEELDGKELDAANKRQAAREKLGVDLLRLQDEINAQDVAVIRAGIEAITETDVASVRTRNALLIDVMHREAASRTLAILTDSKAFQDAARKATTDEADAVIQAQIDLARAQKALDDEEAKQGKARDEAAITRAQEAVSKAVEGVNAAQATLTSSLHDFRLSVRDAIDPTKSFEEIRASLPEKLQNLVSDGDLRKILESLKRERAATDNAEKQQIKANEESLREAIGKARLATITDVAEREREQKRLEAETSLREERKQIVAGEKELTRLREEAFELRIAEQADFTRRMADATNKAASDQAKREADYKTKIESAASDQEKARLEAELRAKNAEADAALAKEIARLEREHRGRLDHIGRTVLDEQQFTQRMEDLRAQRADADRRAADLEVQAELDKHDEVKTLNAFVDAFRTNLSNKLSLQDQERIQKEIEGLDTERKALHDKYNSHIIDAETYDAKLKELSDKRTALQQQLDEQSINVLDAFNAGLAGSFTALQTTFAASTATATDQYAQGTGQFLDVLGAAGLQFTAILGRATFEQQNIADNALKAAGKLAFDFLDKMVPVWSAQILGISLATPDAVATLGTTALIKYGILTGLLKLAVGTARSIAGFYDAGYTGNGNPRDVAGVVHRQEFVHGHEVTRVPENRMLFEHLHRGGTQEQWFVDRFGKYFVGPDGRWLRDHVDAVHASTRQQMESLRTDMKDSLDTLNENVQFMASRFESHRFIHNSFGRVEVDQRTLHWSVDQQRHRDAILS
ncbi:MAG TPA: phage tail tape measure protein [Candidatus Kapabacteria bacterium]|nr:phage tail tape measure protein [Candidatus Kapabacteria bacterium]